MLLGLLAVLLALGHAFYFKRPLSGRHGGMPFIVTRLGFLVLDKSYAAKAMRQRQLIGIKEIRYYLDTCI